MTEDLDRLLGRMNRIFYALPSHTDRRLNKIVHLLLPGKVPGMPFIPHSDDQLTAIQKACSSQFRWGLVLDTIPYVVVRRGTRPDIPDAVGKNLEGDSWVIVLT